MLNRRKMFSAIIAVGGVSAVTADHAVAMAFDDGDYLRERRERLAKHAAEVNRLDEARRVANAKSEQEAAIRGRYLSQARRAMALNQNITITVPADHFDLLQQNNLIDFIPNAEGEHMIPVLLGQAVKVAGL